MTNRKISRHEYRQKLQNEKEVPLISNIESIHKTEKIVRGIAVLETENRQVYVVMDDKSSYLELLGLLEYGKNGVLNLGD